MAIHHQLKSKTDLINRFRLKIETKEEVKPIKVQNDIDLPILTVSENIREYYPTDDTRDHQWGSLLLYRLQKVSGCFKVKQQEFPRINIEKYRNCLIPFKINNDLFLIDDWDWDAPLSKIDDSFFELNPFYKDIKIIFKLQYYHRGRKLYSELKKKFNIIVLPFSFFPSVNFKFNQYIWKLREFKYFAFFSGAAWRCRTRFLNYFKTQKDIALSLGRYRLPLLDWIKTFLRHSKWGIILMGKGGGGVCAKNRREPELMSMGIPLALNYKPVYYFDFRPGVDYVYLEKPEDINKLRNLDPVPFHQRSLENYRNYFSPEGTAKLLKKIYLDYKNKITPKHLINIAKADL